MLKLIRSLVLASLVLGSFSPVFAGNKSHVPGSRDGTYVGPTGSSHKGSHYVNPNTGNHYRDRQHGERRQRALMARVPDETRMRVETSSRVGALALLGRSLDQNSATLTVEGMQAIAWMPVLPP